MTTSADVTALSAVIGGIALLLVALLAVSATAGTYLGDRPWETRRRAEAALDYSMVMAALACVITGLGHAEATDHWDALDVVVWLVGGLIVAIASVTVVTVAARRHPPPPPRTATAVPGTRLTAMVVCWAVSWVVAAGVGLYGALSQGTTVLAVALTASSWIGLAGMLRALFTLRTVRAHYLELDHALFRREQAEDVAKKSTRG